MSDRDDFFRALGGTARFFLIGLAIIFGLFLLFLLGLVAWVVGSW